MFDEQSQEVGVDKINIDLKNVIIYFIIQYQKKYRIYNYKLIIEFKKEFNFFRKLNNHTKTLYKHNNKLLHYEKNIYFFLFIYSLLQ